MKKIFAIIILFSALSGYAQITFEKTFGGAGDDVGYSVQQTNDGGYIIAGWTQSFGAGNYDGYLIKTNSVGDTLWTKTFGGLFWDDCYTVKQTSDNGYIIAGGSDSDTTGYNVKLIKTDAAGDILWTKIYGGIDVDRGYSLQLTNDSCFIIAGTTWSFGAGWYDVYLIKTNADGDVLWSKTYGGAYGDYGNSVQQTSDNGYIITGMTETPGTVYEDVYLVKTNSVGDTLWTKTFGGIGNENGNSVIQTTDGSYVITGITYSFGAGYADLYLIKTNSDGDSLWTKTFGGTNIDYGKSVLETTDGNYVITGMLFNSANASGDVCLIKTNPDGDVLWTNYIGGSYGDVGNCVQQTNDDGFIIAGQTNSYGAGNFDVYLVKTNMDGIVVSDNETKAEQNDYTVFPNPASDKIEITGPENGIIEIINLQGQTINTLNLSDTKTAVDISKLSGGVYTIRIKSDSGIAVRKFIKQ